MIVMDGLLASSKLARTVRFKGVRLIPAAFLPPDHDAVARVLAGTARRLQRIVAKRAAEDEDALARDEPLLAALAAASPRARSASGPNAGERWRRLGNRVEPATWNDDPEAARRIPQHRGLSLHAAVAVPARDRRRLERLRRYVARPSLANERLEEHPDGRLALRLKTRWRDGTSHILMERSELIDRLVPLIPPPRAHQARYHGILAPCASRRDRVVPARAAAFAVAGRGPGTAPVVSIESSARAMCCKIGSRRGDREGFDGWSPGRRDTVPGARKLRVSFARPVRSRRRLVSPMADFRHPDER